MNDKLSGKDEPKLIGQKRREGKCEFKGFTIYMIKKDIDLMHS